GRFGPFLASENYPASTFVLNLDRRGAIKYPAVPPLVIPAEEGEDGLHCEKCGSALNLRRGKKGPWLGCSRFPKCRGRTSWAKVPEERREQLEAELSAHEQANPVPKITRHDGSVIPEGTPVNNLLLPGGVAELEIHPEAGQELSNDAA
ncbi:MAG: topoisomerase DNA-binding C4 zinc finger domain-containing protein, partial [Planctomycetes bacterium]|nr:topoisomerase DNA-binding C4 zinc finger domain-containing protein [Planctomycetota bacterium]